MIPMVEKILFLKGVELFERIPAEELSLISSITEEVYLSPEEPVFLEGDDGDALYLVVDGTVRVHSGDRVIGEMGEGECFGEMAILDTEPRSASVTTQNDVVLLQISREDFSELLYEKPEISRGVILVLTQRIREINRKKRKPAKKAGTK
ncbi:MAG: cyclic nucleotide-binding domain-containing protein [Spirochaetales bacterium]|jgi:CRP/FNR family transcriptional regulator, cyclic AMP receptor protein|nr:cyclic nucleotide-binding domain-containing protein [Spirochaetales bacterium]